MHSLDTRQNSRSIFLFKLIVCLCVFIVFAFIFNSLGVPFTEPAAYGRSSVNAMMSFNYYINGFNFLEPRINYGSFRGVAYQEFPLIQYLVAILYIFFGVTEYVGRGQSLFFAICTALLFINLSRNLNSSWFSGYLVVLNLSLSPMFVFFSRVYQSDSATIFFWSLSFVMLLYKGKHSCINRIVSLCAYSITVLLKPNFVILMPAYAIILTATQDPRYCKIRYLIPCFLLTLTPAVVFYTYAQLHSDYVSQMGIVSVLKRVSLNNLLSINHFVQISKDLVQTVTPLGILSLILYFIRTVKEKRLDKFATVYISCFVLMLVLFNEAISHHEYYNLAILPLVCYCTIKLFENQNIDFIKFGYKSIFAYIIAFIISIPIFYNFMDKRLNYPTEAELRFLASQWITLNTTTSDLLVTIDGPDILYYSNRNGYILGATYPITFKEFEKACQNNKCSYLVIAGVEELNMFDRTFISCLNEAARFVSPEPNLLIYDVRNLHAANLQYCKD